MDIADDVLALEADEIEIARKLSAEQAEAFRQNDEFTVQYGPGIFRQQACFQF